MLKRVLLVRELEITFLVNSEKSSDSCSPCVKSLPRQHLYSTMSEFILAKEIALFIMFCAGLWRFMVVYHTIHLIWSQDSVQHCTHSGSF